MRVISISVTLSGDGENYGFWSQMTRSKWGRILKKTIFPLVPNAIIEISGTELVFNHPIEDIFVKFRNISVQINRAKTPTGVLDAQQRGATKPSWGPEKFWPCEKLIKIIMQSQTIVHVKIHGIASSIYSGKNHWLQVNMRNTRKLSKFRLDK